MNSFIIALGILILLVILVPAFIDSRKKDKAALRHDDVKEQKLREALGRGD